MPNDLTAEIDTAPSSVEQIADLARRDAERTPSNYNLDADRSLVVARVRDDEKLEVHDLERYLDVPNRARGHVVVHDPGDFVEVVNRQSNLEYTTVWANVDAGTVTAVINDHAGWGRAGWRDNTVQLTLQPDEDWAKWMQFNERLLPQADFASFVEDVSHTIIEPDNATMLEVASTMFATQKVEFSQSTRLQTGDVALKFEETTAAKAGAKGQMEVPERIVVRLSPWRGVMPADIDGRLRFQIRSGQLAIGYKLIRPDAFRTEVFDGLVQVIKNGLDTVPLYRGQAPASLR
jgi:uncharacterized protein YfdQ (DUF2303 family)